MIRFGWRIRAMVAVGAMLCASACSASTRSISPTDAASPLKLVRTIALPDVKGRIDHLAVDLAHRLLFVAEYGNGSVDVIDLDAGKVVDRITGLKEPQGLGVTLDNAQLVVAGGDGSVGFYDTRTRRPLGRIVLGDDADNVRIDPRQGNVVIGYGAGALAIVDPASRRVIGSVPLPAHPEGFRLAGSRFIVNVPDRGEIVAGDLDSGKALATWKTGGRHLNFPLALDPAGKWFAIAYRLPAALELRNQSDGAIVAVRPACGDADDLFVDGERLYLVCGAGHVYVASLADPKAAPISVTTAPGGRTGLFVPERRQLFVAVPARGASAAILVLSAPAR
ncbi:MAG: YncE family protein [Sphingomonas sp.]|uniref:YncE family protein n=1 Tax=Sphingomonas sp. TaxID=28214 RepID=UPI003F7D4063